MLEHIWITKYITGNYHLLITALIQDSYVVQEGGFAFSELRKGKPSITI